MNNKKLQELADKAAKDLFTNGNGDKADRLVLTSKNGRDLGGWCETVVSDHIFCCLLEVKGNNK